MTLDQIRDALADRRIDKVAEATGIHRNTVAKIRSGENRNPSYSTVRRLAEYLALPLKGGADAS